MEVKRMNLKLIVLAIIATLLVMTPLVAAAPMLGQILDQYGSQNSNTVWIKNQQQLQTGDCTDLESCNTKIITNEVRPQNYACSQNSQNLQASNCAGLAICNTTLAKVVVQDNNCTCTYGQECVRVNNGNTIGTYNRTSICEQCRNQTSQQECVGPQEIYCNCNDNSCYLTQQQYSYSQQRQNHHGNNCR